MSENQRKGDWIETYTGKQFWPLDPRAEEVDILDIAHALSLICRFGGHCRHHYSVAQHSVLVMRFVEYHHPDGTGLLMASLLHDAAEAYIGDHVRSVKRFLNIRAIEQELQVCIDTKYACAFTERESIRWADNALLKMEHAQLMTDKHVWGVDGVTGDLPNFMIEEMTPSGAEMMFKREFTRLQARRIGGSK